jgi:hypothetical protein
MQMRRLKRIPNAFSKKWDDLRAAYCLHFACYNFCWIHKTLGVTLHQEPKLTDNVWDLQSARLRPVVARRLRGR